MSNSKSNKIPYVVLTIAIAITSFVIGRLSHDNPGILEARDTSRVLQQLDLDSSTLPVAGSPSKGSTKAPVTVVVFTDYESDSSKVLWKNVLDNAMNKYGDERLRVVYKAFPLKEHPNAFNAALAVAAASRQNKFWEMHDWLNSQKSYDDILANAKVKDLGMDPDQFKDDLKGEFAKTAVNNDIALGNKLGLQSIPAIFINGKLMNKAEGIDISELDSEIATELRRVAAIPSQLPNGNYIMAGITNHSFLEKDVRDYNLCNAPKILNYPMRGNENAKVTILEFSDYECPYCSKAEKTLHQLLEQYPNDIRIAFVHRPLDFHKHAKLAHQAAYAAGLQGKFWEMHDLLFLNQKALQKENLIKYAKQIGLNIQQFEFDMTSNDTVKAVEENIRVAESFGVTGTPAFSINGEMIRGAQPDHKFKAVIEKQLARAKTVAQQKDLCGDALYQELTKDVKKMNPGRQPDNKVPEGRLNVELAGAPIFGNPNAPITIVEFTDFQCPFCSKGNTTIKEIVKNNPDKVRLAFRHYPLPMHKKAPLAHRAAEAANQQGKFWEYYQILFDNQKAVDRDDLIKYAKNLGLDVARFTKDLDDPSLDAVIKRDIELGNRVKVQGTPHFFINGKRFVGAQPINIFQTSVDMEYKIALPYIQQHMTPEQIYNAVISKSANAANPAAEPTKEIPAGLKERKGARIQAKPNTAE